MVDRDGVNLPVLLAHGCCGTVVDLTRTHSTVKEGDTVVITRRKLKRHWPRQLESEKGKEILRRIEKEGEKKTHKEREAKNL